MKKYLFVTLFFFIAFLSFSQGFYFDIGIGVGSPTTKIDGKNVAELFDSSVKEVGVEVGLKLGYGPVAKYPLYIVGEISGIGHRFYDAYNYIQFNSYLIGPGLIYYPTSLIQLGISLGFSFVSNQTDLPLNMYDSENGFAWNVYTAIDLGGGNNGFLVGVKYSASTNTLEVSGAKQEMSLFSIFIKYAYRHK